MKKYIYLVVTLVLFASCGGGSEDLKKRIEEKEKSISSMNSKDLEKMSNARNELVELLFEYYRTNPEEDYSAQCLDKVQMVYSSQRKYELAAKYGDTLIEKYPNYENRELVLESQYNNYDMFVKPRNVEKAKYYLELLLKEYPDMPKERKEEFEYRLKYIGLTIEQIMRMDMEKLN